MYEYVDALGLRSGWPFVTAIILTSTIWPLAGWIYKKGVGIKSKMNENEISGKPEQNTKLGIYLIVTSTLLFTLMDGLIKWTGETYPVIQLIFFRCAFALFPIGLMLWKEGGISSLKTKHPLKHFFRGTVGMLAMFCVFTSFTKLPMADVVSILFIVPLLTSILAIPILGEKIGLHRSIAIVVGFIGVLIIVQPGPSIVTSDTIYPVVAACLMSCAMITVRLLGRHDGGSVIAFYFTLYGIVVSVIGVSYSNWVMPHGIDWILLMTIGVFGGVAQYLTARSFVVAEIASLSPFKYTALLWAAGVAYFVWGEVPDWEVWMGASIIVASSLYTLHREVYWAKKDGPLKKYKKSYLKTKLISFLMRN